MKCTRFVIGLLVLGVAVLFAGQASAAAPLGLELRQVEIFRHVLDDDDWLVLARFHLVPTSAITFSDSFASVSVTSEAFDDPVTLTNRVIETTGADYTVTADSTDITSYCALEDDLMTIDCAGTGLGDDTYSVVIDYRSGWLAYSGSDALVRLWDDSTLIDEEGTPDTGFMMVGAYLSANDVTDAGISWEGANISLEASASPVLWASPSSQTVTSITWHGTATQAETEVDLTITVRDMLRRLEVSDPDIDTADYVAVNGITEPGAVIATNAWPLIPLAIPESFLTTSFNPFGDYEAADTSLVDTIETDIASTDVAGAWTSLGNLLGGISGHAAGGLVFSILAIVVAGVIVTKVESPGIALIAAWSIIMTGWLLGALPAFWVFLPAGLIGGYGLLRLSKVVFD